MIRGKLFVDGPCFSFYPSSNLSHEVTEILHPHFSEIASWNVAGGAVYLVPPQSEAVGHFDSILPPRKLGELYWPV